jgi:hypothetical protein
MSRRHMACPPVSFSVPQKPGREIDAENEEWLKELAQKYQVSVQALTHRINNLVDLY